MQVGVCKIRLHIPNSRSLKDKRQVLQSVITRVSNKYNVSIAEVEDQDRWQLATLGIVCLSNNGQQTNRVLTTVADFIRQSRLDAEVIDCQMEFLSVL